MALKVRWILRWPRVEKKTPRDSIGMRAKDISHSELVKYAAARKSDGRTADSIKFELDVARRALKLAQREGWITSLPEFPRIEHLRVRSGFFDAH